MKTEQRKEIPTMTLERRLTADGCDVRRELPPAGLVGELIELATAHADALDIGYTRLHTRNRLWVMGRLAVEMKRWPRMYETYVIETRVLSFNRLFSERVFDIIVDGETIGEARTIWTSIDADTRRQADLSDVVADFRSFSDRQPAMAPIARIKPLGDSAARHSGYTFGITDLDFNGHVTTTRYVELMLNCVSLSEYESMNLRRFDILFHREALCGDSVDLMAVKETDDRGRMVFSTELRENSGSSLHTSARFILEKSNE